MIAFIAGMLLGFVAGLWVCYRATHPRVREVGEKWASTARDDYPRHMRSGY